MFGIPLPDYEAMQWTALCLCAVFVGMSKTGVPGLGIFNVPMLAIAFAAKSSTGLMLPLLAFADLFAVGYYHRHAKWSHVLKLLPWALLGIGVGALLIPYLHDVHMKPLIGGIVLALLGVNFWRQRKGDALAVPTHWAFAASLGFFAGLTTQLANAAGPVMILYLLAMRLPKNEFIGTGAWYFLILNYLKIPLFVWDGRITWETSRRRSGPVHHRRCGRGHLAAQTHPPTRVQYFRPGSGDPGCPVASRVGGDGKINSEISNNEHRIANDEVKRKKPSSVMRYLFFTSLFVIECSTFAISPFSSAVCF